MMHLANVILPHRDIKSFLAANPPESRFAQVKFRVPYKIKINQMLSTRKRRA
jgi:hypothetical protein